MKQFASAIKRPKFRNSVDRRRISNHLFSAESLGVAFMKNVFIIKRNLNKRSAAAAAVVVAVDGKREILLLSCLLLLLSERKLENGTQK